MKGSINDRLFNNVYNEKPIKDNKKKQACLSLFLIFRCNSYN